MTKSKQELGLPVSHDTERLVLGAIMVTPGCFDNLKGSIEADDFSDERHRRIFQRMAELNERGEAIDRVTVYTELMKYAEAESCGGLSYLVTLDDGMPAVVNIEAYVKIVREKSILRKTIFACQSMMNRCMMSEEPSHDILTDAEAMLCKLAQEGDQGRSKWRNPGQVMTEYPGGLNAFLTPQRHANGLSTPWPKLTDNTGGFHEGELVVLAGRPSMGKSVLACQIGVHIAKQFRDGSSEDNLGVALFSLEMTAESLIYRMLAAEGHVDAQRFRLGFLSADERKKLSYAVDAVHDLPLWIDDTHARTVPAIVSALRKLPQCKPRVIVVDHLQLMRSAGRAESLRVGLTEITHALKHIATDFKATLILCSQLNRDCEKEARRPQLSDLQDSGSIEQDADVVLFIHRWEKYAKYRDHQDMRGQAELIMAKQRNGPTGITKLVFLENQQIFMPAAEDYEEAK